MAHMRIIHWHQLELHSSDLALLSDSELAVLVSLSFAADEIRVFENLIVQGLSSAPSDDIAKEMHAYQNVTLIRAHCAKIVETMKLFRDCIKVLERKKDLKSAEKLNCFLPELDVLEKKTEYNISKNLRNETINHFDVSKVRDRASAVRDMAPLHAYLHEERGNSFYALGEVGFFHTGVTQHLSKFTTTARKREALDQWLFWTQDVSRWLKGALEGYIYFLFDDRWPKKRVRRMPKYVEPQFLYRLGEDCLKIGIEPSSAQKWRRDQMG